MGNLRQKAENLQNWNSEILMQEKLEKCIPKLAKHTSPIAHFFHCFLFLFHQFLTQTVTKLI